VNEMCFVKKVANRKSSKVSLTCKWSHESILYHAVEIFFFKNFLKKIRLFF
jgi:hypothetical protein